MDQNAQEISALVLGIDKQNAFGQSDRLVEQKHLTVSIKTSTRQFQTQTEALNALTEGQIHAYACPLQLAPLTLPTGLVITALSKREDARICLFANAKYEGNEGLFAKKNKPKILALSPINCAQMQYLEPNYQVEQANLTTIQGIEAVRLGDYDAVVLGQSDINTTELDTEKWHIHSFSTKEFIPSVGQGAICFIAAEDDLKTRRLLKQIHHPSVSAVTNIERTVQKMLKNEGVCAYCERDRMGNYHLWAAVLIDGQLRKTRLSQSTSFGMAEKICEQLLSA